jgi:hypothetical protein
MQSESDWPPFARAGVSCCRPVRERKRDGSGRYCQFTSRSVPGHSREGKSAKRNTRLEWASTQPAGDCSRIGAVDLAQWDWRRRRAARENERKSRKARILPGILPGILAVEGFRQTNDSRLGTNLFAAVCRKTPGEPKLSHPGGIPYTAALDSRQRSAVMSGPL